MEYGLWLGVRVSARILYVMRDTMSGNAMLGACICVAGHSTLSHIFADALSGLYLIVEVE